MKLKKIILIFLFSSVCIFAKTQIISTLFDLKNKGLIFEFQKKIDNNFSEDWVFDSLRIENINHGEKGYLLTWGKKVEDLEIWRTYTFKLNHEFVNAYEQRFLNDTLYSQGYIFYKDNSIDYIIQVKPKKETLHKNLGYWDYDVDHYIYEIYENGILSCIYKVAGRNHYYMLFQKRKEKIELLKGNDCLSILGNNN